MTKIRGTAGDDIIQDGNGNDMLLGGAGNDWMQGGGGNDYIVGGVGNDAAWGDDGNDTLVGMDGNDVLSGGDGVNFLAGGNGDDILFVGEIGQAHGGEGNDELVGGSSLTAQSVLYAGNGDDTLVAGASGGGDNAMYGGSGHDLFVAAPGYGVDPDTGVAYVNQVGDAMVFDFRTGEDHLDVGRPFASLDTNHDSYLGVGDLGVYVDQQTHSGLARDTLHIDLEAIYASDPTMGPLMAGQHNTVALWGVDHLTASDFL